MMSESSCNDLCRVLDEDLTDEDLQQWENADCDDAGHQLYDWIRRIEISDLEEDCPCGISNWLV